MSLKIKDFFYHNSPEVRQAAIQVFTYQDRLSQGQITTAEYNDLIADTVSLEKIDQLTNNLEQRKTIQTAFETILKIASVASSL